MGSVWDPRAASPPMSLRGFSRVVGRVRGSAPFPSSVLRAKSPSGVSSQLFRDPQKCDKEG